MHFENQRHMSAKSKCLRSLEGLTHGAERRQSQYLTPTADCWQSEPQQRVLTDAAAPKLQRSFRARSLLVAKKT
jgi:hypothetical protein